MTERKMKKTAGTKLFKDGQKEKRIQEHLTNEKDVISEEDIRNVRTDIEVIDGNHTIVDIPGNTPHHNIDTSWNIMED
ncbi:MAG: hypothetical protein ABI402_11065 [Ferruginibacter sp.]